MALMRTGRTLAAGAAILAATAYAVAPTPAMADWHHGGVSTGAAVGIGLGAFALGSALGAGAHPYYGYPGYGYYGYPAYGYGYPAYTAPAYPYYGSSYYAPAYSPYWGY